MRAAAGLSVAVLVAAACGGDRGAAGPPWPRSAGHVPADSWEEDGGESLAPRHARMSAAERSASTTVSADLEVTIDVEISDDTVTPQPPGEPTLDDDVTAGETIIIDGEPPPEPDPAPEPEPEPPPVEPPGP
jgi:hypothetical protein